jgi:hypothetical protein
MILECVAMQLDKSINDLPPINAKISACHSAVVTFHSPSDPSGTHGMRRELIHSTPLWRGHKPRRDCAFVAEDEMKPGMSGMNIVRVILFFSFEHERVYYPCALVEWFERVQHDPVTGLWIVRPDIIHGGQNRRSVLHLDAFLRGVHLIPVYGTEMLPVGFDYSDSLDAFSAFYVNKYIDHHANEIAF